MNEMMEMESILDEQRSLPQGRGQDGIVQWRYFRRREDAVKHLHNAIRLADDQTLVGGCSQDSLGPLWWVGVKVGNVGDWGNLQAVNKHGASP